MYRDSLSTKHKKKRKLTTLKHRGELTAFVLYQVPSSPFKMKTILISVGRRNRSHSRTICFLKLLRFISVVKIPEVWHEGGATQFLVFTHLWLRSPNDHEQTQDEPAQRHTAVHPASLVYRNVISVTRVLKRVIKLKLFASSNKGKLVITAEATPKSPTKLDCSGNGIVGLNLVRSIRERHSVIK